MKSFLSILTFVFISVTGFSQNGIYLFGFMENAPQEPVNVEATIYSNPPVTVILQTEPSGNIPTQWVALPSSEWNGLQTSFENCSGNTLVQYTSDSLFENLIDIPIYLTYCEDSTQVVYGCTDPMAINYSPEATIDDGSCEYESNCELNEVTVVTNTENWGTEISWHIKSDSATVIASGSGFGDNSVASSTLCLADGCYVLEMFDSYGDGWNGGSFQILLGDSIITTGTLASGHYGQVAFGINATGCEIYPVYGCTDPTALNYNPNANLDDGSCEYPAPPAVNDLCTDAIPLEPGTILIDNSNATQNEGIWGSCWGFGQGEGEQSSIWYSFTTPDVPAGIHLEASYDGTNTLTDTQFGIFAECGGEMIYCDGNSGQGLMSALDFACGELQQNTTYIFMIDGWNGDAGTCYLTYSIDTTCTDIAGCTDPEAINYNPDATIDDGSCEYETPCTPVTLVFDGSSLSHGSWELANQDSIVTAGYYQGSDMTFEACLNDGCYTLAYYPNNDSLLGVSYTVFMDNQIYAGGTFYGDSFASFQIGWGCDSTNVIYGCTDPEAINYNPDALIDDGSCEYETIPCENNEVVLTINTDNWASEMSWNLVQNGEEIEGDGIYQNDTQYTYSWCLEDGCYQFEMFDSYGDGWNGASYSIVYNDTVLADGTLQSGSYSAINFGVNQEGCNPVVIYGCTDPTAINYNPDATNDDGSCMYETDCTEVLLYLDSEEGGYVQYVISSGDSLVNWGPYNDSGYPIQNCLADGCYTLTLFADSTGWVEFDLTADSLLIAHDYYVDQYEYAVDFSIGAGCDSTSEVYGCTDPEAINYNPDATVDDGSCIYQYDCSVSFQVIPDSIQNVIWILPTENISESVEVLWDFGDGTTSTELFPEHTYEDEGPYNLCLTVTFINPDNSTCSVTFCTEVDGTLINGSGFGPTGFTINIVNDIATTAIGNTEAGDQSIHLYPNPVSNQITVNYNTRSNASTTLSIYDITGKRIIQKISMANGKDATETIDVSQLQSGVYILEIENNDLVQTARFVKTN